jgi:hypothetical protein
MVFSSQATVDFSFQDTHLPELPFQLSSPQLLPFIPHHTLPTVPVNLLAHLCSHWSQGHYLFYLFPSLHSSDTALSGPPVVTFVFDLICPLLAPSQPLIWTGLSVLGLLCLLLVDLPFYLEDGGSVFLWNDCEHIPDCRSSHPSS